MPSDGEYSPFGEHFIVGNLLAGVKLNDFRVICLFKAGAGLNINILGF